MSEVRSIYFSLFLILNAIIGGAFYFGYNMSVLNTSGEKIATHFGWDE